MKIRQLAILAVLAALPAGILTNAAITPAGAQNIAHVRVLDTVAANRATPAGKAHCVTMGTKHGHPATTLKCVGYSVSAMSPATAAAQVTKFSNARFGMTAASGEQWTCVLYDVQISVYDVIYVYDCTWWDPYYTGGGS
jgi:hypothetical protein